MDLFDMGEGYDSLQDGLTRVKCPVMVIGVQTDILFPIWQQRTLAELLQKSGKGSNFQYKYHTCALALSLFRGWTKPLPAF